MLCGERYSALSAPGAVKDCFVSISKEDQWCVGPIGVLLAARPAKFTQQHLDRTRRVIGERTPEHQSLCPILASAHVRRLRELSVDEFNKFSKSFLRASHTKRLLGRLRGVDEHKDDNRGQEQQHDGCLADNAFRVRIRGASETFHLTPNVGAKPPVEACGVSPG